MYNVRQNNAQLRQQRAKCRLSARRALGPVVCYLAAAGSVAYEVFAVACVKLFLRRFQGFMYMTSSDTSCHVQPLSAFQAADPRFAAAKSAAQLLLQSQLSLVKQTMVRLTRFNLICSLTLPTGLINYVHLQPQKQYSWMSLE